MEVLDAKGAVDLLAQYHPIEHIQEGVVVIYALHYLLVLL